MTTITKAPTSTVRNEVTDLEQLRARLAGELITPDSEDYDDVRQVPVMTQDGRPRAIVRAANTQDVVEAVRFASAHGRPLSVRSGGHSVPGYNMVDDALVVDLSQLRGVSIDHARGTARVGPGANSGELMAAGHAYGLALSTGDTATVGLGGLTTGGGIGFMVRKHGLAIDNLISAQVVTADGGVVRASADEHADLFWAIRGGGGNFGIITEFEFRMAQVGQVLGGALVLPATRDVLRGFHDYVAEAPEDLTTIANLMHAPPAPFIPEDRVGELVLMVLAVWTGDIEEGQKAFAPLRALAEPVADAIAPMPYPVIYQFTAAQEQRHGAAIRSMFADDHSDATFDAILDAMNAPAGPMNMVQFRGMGGAVGRVGEGDTAFAHRRQRFFTTVLGLWLDPDDDPQGHWDWTNALWEKIRGDAAGVYVNFLHDEGEDRIRDAYPAATYKRLCEAKRKYDPENMFCFNQNIRPR
jgi:FAD/FMN-containing dehydrogenase